MHTSDVLIHPSPHSSRPLPCILLLLSAGGFGGGGYGGYGRWGRKLMGTNDAQNAQKVQWGGYGGGGSGSMSQAQAQAQAQSGSWGGMGGSGAQGRSHIVSDAWVTLHQSLTQLGCSRQHCRDAIQRLDLQVLHCNQHYTSKAVKAVSVALIMLHVKRAMLRIICHTRWWPTIRYATLLAMQRLKLRHQSDMSDLIPLPLMLPLQLKPRLSLSPSPSEVSDILIL
jgi:hypothetical protein